MESAKRVNKKYIATMLVLCIAIVAMLGAIVGIWAATSQNVNTYFKVNYSVGNNVAAKVRAERYVPDLDADENGHEDGVITINQKNKDENLEGLDDNGYITFKASDTEGAPAAEMFLGDVKLNPYAKKAYFYFTIESLQGRGYVRVLCNATYETKQNINANISYCNIDEGATFDSASSASTIVEENWTKAHYNNIPAGGYKMIRVELSVINMNRNAQCGGNIDITLDYSNVTGTAPVDETIKSEIQNTLTNAAENENVYLGEKKEVFQLSDGYNYFIKDGNTYLGNGPAAVCAPSRAAARVSCLDSSAGWV